MSKIKELLKTVKKLNKQTATIVNAAQVLYGNEDNKFLPKESLSSFPIQKGVLDWSKSHELGNNILGIRIPSDDSIRFILRAVDDGIYDNHYHDCLETVKVLNQEGELTFNIEGRGTVIADINNEVSVKTGVKHSVTVKKGTSFQVDFK